MTKILLILPEKQKDRSLEIIDKAQVELPGFILLTPEQIPVVCPLRGRKIRRARISGHVYISEFIQNDRYAVLVPVSSKVCGGKLRART